MVVMTAKLSKTKLIAGLLILAAIIALLVLVFTNPVGPKEPEDNVSVSTNEERIAFLSSFGWSVSGEPVTTQQVKIPTDASEVFDRYNALQQSQGYDLTDYAGKVVSRYVYEVQNFDQDAGPAYATMLVHKGQVIGGDIASSSPDGVMQGFTKQAK